jgi:hypothetical protein
MTVKRRLLDTIDLLYNYRNMINRDLTDNELKVITSDIIELDKQAKYVCEKINNLNKKEY